MDSVSENIKEEGKINKLSKIKHGSQNSMIDILNICDIKKLSTNDFLSYLSRLNGKYNSELLEHIDKRFYKLVSNFFNNLEDILSIELFDIDSIFEYQEINNYLESISELGIDISKFFNEIEKINNIIFLSSNLGFIFNVFLNEPSEFNYNYLINAIQEGKNKGIDFFDIRLIFINLIFVEQNF